MPGRATPQQFQHQPTQQPPAFTSPQPSCFSCGAGVPFDLNAALEALGQATDRHGRSGAQSTQGGHQPHQGAQGGQGGAGGIQQGHVEAALVVLASAFGAHLQPNASGPITPPQPTHAPSSSTRGDETSKGRAKVSSGGSRSAGKTEKRKTKARAPPSPPSPPSSDDDDDSSSDDSSSDESSSGEDSEMGEHDSSRKGSKGIKSLSTKRLGTIESDCNPATLIADQRNFREVLSRHHPRLARVLKADERRWKEMKKEKKYKEANKFVADAWYDSRKPSVYVDNMKREIPSKRVNDGRFILARELDTKTAKMGAEVLTAEAKFEKLTFKGAKDLAQVKDRSYKIQGEYLTLPGKSESSIGPAEVQLMLIGKMPDSHAAARAALKLEFLQRECEGALWTVVTVERRIALALGSAANEANTNASNLRGKGEGGKGGDRKNGGGERDTRPDTAGSSCYNCGKPGHSARDCEERGKCGCKNCPCCHGEFCIVGANKKIVPEGSNHTKAKNAVGGQLSKMILERLRDKQKKKKPALYRGADAHEADGQEEGDGEEQGDEGESPEVHVSDFGTAVHPHARGGPTLHASHGGWQAPEGGQRPSKGRGGGGKGAGGRGAGGQGRVSKHAHCDGPFRTINQIEADGASDDGAGVLFPTERDTSLDAIVDSSSDENVPSDDSSNPPSLSAASTSESESDDGFDKQQLKAAVAQSLVQEGELDQAEKEADRELKRALKEARVTEKLERAARIREENRRRKEAQHDVDFPPLGAPTPSLGSSIPSPAFVPTRRPQPSAAPEGWTTVKKRAGKAKALQANCGGQPQRKMA